MHELAALLPNAAVNQTHSCRRSAAPAGSEYRNWKVWTAPLPELGVTETAAGPAGTVQIPRCCQPLLAVLPAAYIHTCLAPANAAVNVSGTDSVKLLPLGVSVVELKLILHWLFCKVALAPSVPGSQAVPASLI